MSPSRRLRVAIIGAGLGGIAAAVKLRQRTSADFVIFEQSGGIGGTWRDNVYPGCEVDIHSHAYSYSFLRYEWPRTHATQPELLAYAEHVAEVYGLTPHLRLNTKVTSLAWEESAARYMLGTEPAKSCACAMPFCEVATGLSIYSPPPGPLRMRKLTSAPVTMLSLLSVTVAVSEATPPLMPILSGERVNLIFFGIDETNATFRTALPAAAEATTVAVVAKFALFNVVWAWPEEFVLAVEAVIMPAFVEKVMGALATGLPLLSR